MSATGANAPTLTYEQAKARKRRRELVHPIVTDSDTVVVYRLAEQDLRKVKLRGNPEDIAAAQARADAAEKAVRDATLLFRLRALPRRGEGTYSALKAEHPPTEADNERARQETGDDTAKARWHSDTFGPALVAACLIDPPVTVEQATEMAADWNDAEWDSLFIAAITVNETVVDTAGLVFS